MVTKSKKLLINNPLLKFLSLFILSISLSILFESYLYTHRMMEFALSQKSLVAFVLGTTLISLIVYLTNRKANIKFLYSFARLLNIIAPIEILVLILLFFCVIREYISMIQIMLIKI